MNRSIYLVLFALLAGLVAGALAASSGSPDFQAAVRFIEPIGTLWTNAIRMTVVPLVVALIINGIAGRSDSAPSLGQSGRRLVLVFVGLLALGGVVSLAVGMPLMQRLEIPADVATQMRQSAQATAQAAAQPTMPSLRDRILEIVPVNPIRAAADGAMLPLIVFALIFALALTKLDQAQRQPIVNFFRALGEAMLILVGWVLKLAPIGIFALAVALGARMGAFAAGALLYYVATLAGALIVYIALLYPVVWVLARTSMKDFALAVAPAQQIALGTRSSLAALPALIAGAQQHLKAAPHVTGFVLPLAVSVFRANVPIAWVVGVLFLGKLYGVELDLFDMLTVIAVGSFLSFSVPGIPSASLFLLAPLLNDLGIPGGAGAGILIAVDAIPDMFKTTANVTSHMAVAAVEQANSRVTQ